MRNLNWSSSAVREGQQIEVRLEQHQRLGIIEQAPDVWRLARYSQTLSYALDSSLVLDADKPISVSTFFSYQDMVAPTTSFVGFTAAELLGAWTVEHLNKDDVLLTSHCREGAAQCSDIILFNADNTAITELSGRSATWLLTEEGHVEVTFADNGTVVTLRRLSQGADTSTVMISFDTGMRYVNDVDMMVKRDAPAPTDISEFFGTFVTNSFTVTTDLPSYARRSSVDGGYIGVFGFMLEADGTGERVLVSTSEESINRRTLSWTQSGSRFESDTCLYSVDIDGEAVCRYVQNRAWDLVKVTDSRFYVHETLSATEDLDGDGEFAPDYSISRPNFYELTPYYDLTDVDRDGYSNEADAFPFDETEWLDSDGDGLGDNTDPDADPDGDGVLNANDAFPQDPAASVDSDNDGAPDAWNSDATEEQIAQSDLTIDELPLDGSEVLDSDRDGIGNNADPDDDNDGVLDEDEVALGTNPFDRDSDDDGATDGGDAFPLDPTEQRDNDPDGIGDTADTDDDMTASMMRVIYLPFHAGESAFIPADLTTASMPYGVVSFIRSVVPDPAVRQGGNWPAWTFNEDGSYRSRVNNAAISGSWSAAEHGYRLTSTPEQTQFPLISSDMTNIDWSSEQVQDGNQIEVRVELASSLAVIERSDETWRLVRYEEVKEYAIDESLAIDPSLPIRISVSEPYEFDAVAPTASFVDFTAVELLGAWTIEHLNVDNVLLTNHCLEGSQQCSDIIRFNADNTAITELSGRSATWGLTSEGSLRSHLLITAR